MGVRNPTKRIANDLANLRSFHRNQLSKALNGLHIDTIDIDKIYTRRLSNINIMEEFFNERKR